MSKKQKAQINSIDPTVEKSASNGFFGISDISSLVAFRIFFGLLLFMDVSSYIVNEGWIASFWVQDIIHFKYWPLDFIEPLPGNGMYFVFYGMALLAIFVSIGLFYRISITLFFLLFSYTFLIEETIYLNHFYLIILVSFLMIFMPASNSFSVDRLLKRVPHQEWLLNWQLWSIKAIIGIPYFFGGLAKINHDWLNGEPLRMWLRKKTDFPLIGQFFQDEWMVMFMSYSGLLLDLLVVPALLWKKTRWPAFILICMFHVMNSQLFVIAIFPWFMIAATTIYFQPDWFRNLVNRFSSKKWKFQRPKNLEIRKSNKFIAAFVGVFFIIQILVPLRHHLYPGNISWTDEGYYFSWHMMLRHKKGKGNFIIESKVNGERRNVIIEDYLPEFQRKRVFINPKLMWEFAQVMKQKYAKHGFDVAVYADIQVSMNDREYQQMTNPNVDLTSVENPIYAPANWIIPLTTPLKNK